MEKISKNFYLLISRLSDKQLTYSLLLSKMINMRLYELDYLLPSDLPKEEITTYQEKVISSIQKEGGILISEPLISKRKLAYPIKKQTSAYLVSLSFQLKSQDTAEDIEKENIQKKIRAIEKELKSERKILRYLILSKKLPQKISVSKKPTITQRKESEKPKVEFKEINKKLEEILGKIENESK